MRAAGACIVTDCDDASLDWTAELSLPSVPAALPVSWNVPADVARYVHV